MAIIYNFVSLSKMVGKIEFFSGKISWIRNCSQISRKIISRKSAAILNEC